MCRTIRFRALVLVCLALPTWLSGTCFGQATDRRLEDARVDITLMKQTLKEQDRRIAELENTVKALQSAATGSLEKPAVVERAKVATKASVKMPWQEPTAWSQIKVGMSRAQVEAVLGPSTLVDSVIDCQTLICQGYIPGAGALSDQ